MTILSFSVSCEKRPKERENTSTAKGEKGIGVVHSSAAVKESKKERRRGGSHQEKVELPRALYDYSWDIRGKKGKREEKGTRGDLEKNRYTAF